MTGHDHDLRARFDALRRVDAGAVPGFDLLIAEAAARRPRPVVLPATVAAAAAVMLVAGLRFAASRPSVDITVSPSEPSLVTWRSPTGSLLQTPGSELLQTVPTLESSLLRGAP